MPSVRRGGPTSFERDYNKIQTAAARLVAIQEAAKRRGAFSNEDNKVYADNLIELGQAAQSLAKLQQSGEIKDFSLLLQPSAFIPQKQMHIPLNSAASSVDLMLGEDRLDEVTEQQFNESDLLPPNNEGDGYEDVSDSVAITAPKKDASVAEAKPIGLSIVGEGGVASAKPNAVALSGRNGLAVSSPKATAIAGVSPEEAAAFSVSLPSRNHLVIKSTPSIQRFSVGGSQRPFYDEYDYSELVPVRSNFHDVPGYYIDRSPTVGVSKLKSTGDGGDPYVNRWKTVIAEDYAASQPIIERGAHPEAASNNGKSSNKLALRAGDRHALYIF